MKFWKKEKKLKMINLDSLFLFTFIFSILTVLRTVFRFISALLQNPPKPFVMSSRELFLLGITVSYALTYLIKL
jgi:hypothetical protein